MVKASSFREGGLCERNPLLLLFQTENNGVPRDRNVPINRFVISPYYQTADIKCNLHEKQLRTCSFSFVLCVSIFHCFIIKKEKKNTFLLCLISARVYVTSYLEIYSDVCERVTTELNIF